MPTFYVTAPRESAQSLARAVVENRLAACVNVVDCDSVYWWEDSVTTDAECILFIKTSTDGTAALIEYIEENHPYDIPCIERFDEDTILFEYARWRDDAVVPAE